MNHRTRTPQRTRRSAVRSGARRRRTGFTLIELLTVMFIIALLIGLLVPSLNAARNSAKRTKSFATLRALDTGLDLFRNENGRDFPQTNGYPPSFSHPRMIDSDTRQDIFDPNTSEFPFIEDKPRVYGAHWVVAMLMGADGQGYIQRRNVPKTKGLNNKPWLWYSPDPFEDGSGKQLDRSTPYVDTTSVRTIRNDELFGARPGRPFFPDWEKMKHLPVFVDAFDQPILYYASNRGGRPTNMVAAEHNDQNEYSGGNQENGPPYYFHEDNEGFTGNTENPGHSEGVVDAVSATGWDLQGGPHKIRFAGDQYGADVLAKPFDPGAPEEHDNFARFIMDRKLLRRIERTLSSGQSVPPAMPLRPVNPDSYLLISAGVDGRYGTSDDVTNFPLDTN